QSLDPALVPRAHVVRVPPQLAAPREQRGPQLGIAPAVADVPLARRDDLERTVALLVELHRVGDRSRLAHERTIFFQQLHDSLTRLLDRLPRERVPVLV